MENSIILFVQQRESIQDISASALILETPDATEPMIRYCIDSNTSLSSQRLQLKPWWKGQLNLAE